MKREDCPSRQWCVQRSWGKKEPGIDRAVRLESKKGERVRGMEGEVGEARRAHG